MTDLTLRDLSTMVGKSNEANGWHERLYTLMEVGDFEGTVDHVIAKLGLIVTEAAEAIEEVRTMNDFEFDRTTYRIHWPVSEDHAVRKPEGLPSELADIIIRTLDLAWMLDIDMETILLEKLEYNETRGYKHGGKVA